MFPTKPSQMTTSSGPRSVVPDGRSRPSTLPWKLKPAVRKRECASFDTEFPFASSSPMLRRPITGSARPSTYSANIDPSHANCTSSSAEQRSEEHTSELQSQSNLVCRLLLEKKKKKTQHKQK